MHVHSLSPSFPSLCLITRSSLPHSLLTSPLSILCHHGNRCRGDEPHFITPSLPLSKPTTSIPPPPSRYPLPSVHLTATLLPASSPSTAPCLAAPLPTTSPSTTSHPPMARPASLTCRSSPLTSPRTMSVSPSTRQSRAFSRRSPGWRATFHRRSALWPPTTGRPPNPPPPRAEPLSTTFSMPSLPHRPPTRPPSPARTAQR